MSKILWKILLIAPAVLGASVLVSPGVTTEIPTATKVTKTLETTNAPVADALLKKLVVADLKTPAPEAMTPSQPAVGDLAEEPARITETPDASTTAMPEDAVSDAGVLEQVPDYGNKSSVDDSLGQVTNVTQLQDVQPGDWAYAAMQELVERYGCIAGYSDGTFRGDRALTRYEFAAGLNACLDRVNELIRAATSDKVRKEDLTTLQRLQTEFAAELATVRGRVDTLEATTAQLEANQFSTTTKLNGEIVLGLTSIVSGENIFGEDVDDVTIFGSRTRLNSDTSFTGQDLLRTRLQAFGLDDFTGRTQTFEGNLAFTAIEEDANNDVEIEELTYTFPIGSSTQVVLAANGADADNFASTVNFLDGDGGSGALSRFGTRNPIYYLVRGSGVGLRQQLGNAFELSLGYLAGDAGNPDEDGGIFNGSYGALAQLVFKPSKRFQLGLTYINSYNRETLTGSPLSNPRTFLSNLSNQPVNINLQPPATSGPRFFPANQPIPAGETLPAGTQLPAGTTLSAATTLPFPVALPVPATSGPRFFPANQPIPAGETLPAGTQLPAGTTLSATTLPFPVTVPAPPPIGTITIPAGTTVPAGTALPTPIALPINLTLPASITLPIDLTIPAAAVPTPIGITTTPAGSAIPAGTALPTLVTLPIDLTLPAPITLPVDLTIAAAAAPTAQPIAFNGTLGELLSQPDFAGIPLGFDLDIPIVSNSYGIELSWQIADNFVLGSWKKSWARCCRWLEVYIYRLI